MNTPNKNININPNAKVIIENLNKTELTPEQLEKLKTGVKELQNLPEEVVESDLDQLIKSSFEENTSFKESFLNYGAEPQMEDLGVFTEIHNLFEGIGGSKLFAQLVEQKGFVTYITSFHLPKNSQDHTDLKDLLKSSEVSPLNTESILKNLGDYTLREVGQILEPLGTALIDSLDTVGISPTIVGQAVSILVLYHGLCSVNEKFIKAYAPSSQNYHKLTTDEKILLDLRWHKRFNHFILLAAPLLVISLFTIKKVVTSGINTGITVDFYLFNSEPCPTSPIGVEENKIILFLAFFKKLPYFIGKFVILILIISLIKNFLSVYSIQLMDPFYIKIFCVFGIIVSFILALDYLVQLLFYSYFKKDVNVIIPTKLPKIVYSYLKELQLLTKLDISYSKFFLYNLVLYIFIIFLLIIILIII